MKQWLIDKGVVPMSNQKARREQIIGVLNKENDGK